jgi:hypothetical protein
LNAPYLMEDGRIFFFLPFPPPPCLGWS